jgi:uncharacterized protein (TIGR03437 family)
MLCVAAMPAFGNLPAFDNTGNSLLSGTYYFREVIYVVGDNAGDLAGEYSAYGTITFNGNGGYTLGTAEENALSSSGSGQTAITGTTGTFTFAASGYGYFTDPLSSSIINYGLISNNTLIASATESGYNTLFIATLISSPVPTASSFQGNYQMAGFIPPYNGSTALASDVNFQLNPDGVKNLGTVNINGYFSGGGTTPYSQSSAATYTFSNGAGVVTFPTNSSAKFYSGQLYLYVSPDRNFVFGGTPGGYDIVVGTKNSGGTPNFSGIYFEAGLDWDATQYATSGYSALDTYYGTYNAVGGTIIGHERLLYALPQAPEGLSYNSTYPSSISNNTYTVTSGSYITQYWFGNNGAIRIGFGSGPSLGINVGIQAPVLSGSGVYLNPMGVVNAASYEPFTAGVSPGEIVVLYGSNLAPSFQAASSLPLPTTLNGVQVTVNGVPAPFYYVSPTQLSVVIPYSAAYSVTSGFPVARIVVTNSSGTSNAVTEFFNLTTPGFFTQNASGVGAPSVYHATAKGFTAVTNSNPAQPGETVVAYMSGLGTTVPSVTEGTATPASPLANTVNGFDVLVGGTEVCGAETNATPCQFIGLAPYLASVYQVNIPIPSSAAAGSTTLELLGPDSDDYQVAIPVGSGSVSASDRTSAGADAVSGKSHVRALRPSNQVRTLPCLNSDKSCGAVRE